MRTGKQSWPEAAYRQVQKTLQDQCRWLPRMGRVQDPRERQLVSELQSLRQRLAEAERERDTARQRLKLLESAGAQHRPAQSDPGPRNDARPPVAAANRQPRRAGRPLHIRVAATGTLLLLGALASATTYLDGQSSALPEPPATLLSHAAPPDGLAVELTGDDPAAQSLDQKPSRQARAGGRGAARAPALAATHRQWGPPLLLPADAKAPIRVIRRSTFDPLVEQQQQDLIDLGFDLGQASADGLKGPRTEQALQEFRALYLSAGETGQTVSDTDLAFLIGVYADLARRDAEKFGLDRGVVAAIRLSSVRTGVEFSYLMELAAVESAFNPEAQAPGSSALGLYQFTHDTWLNTVKSHGEKYGLGRYAGQIEYTVDRRGNRRPRIADAAVYEHLLALRTNPRVAAMLAAESVRDNQLRLSSHFDDQPGRTELYLTHFLGPDGAVSFLKALNETPDSFAADMFPTAAANNQSIFHPRTCNPRTLNEVYEVFSRKFDTARYEDLSLN